jgi:hypothetical protein
MNTSVVKSKLEETSEKVRSYMVTIYRFPITDNVSKIEFKELATEIRQFIHSLEVPPDMKSQRITFIDGQLVEISRSTDQLDEDFKFDYFKQHMMLILKSLVRDIEFYLESRQ